MSFRVGDLVVASTAVAALAVAQTNTPIVREVIPAAAPVGARVAAVGAGLTRPDLLFALPNATAAARIVSQTDTTAEWEVPAGATSGTLRITTGSTTIKETAFTVTSDPAYVQVKTIAGHPLTSNEPLKIPYGVAVLPNGEVYVADSAHHQIRRIGPSGSVSVFAGSGMAGFKDGVGASAELKNPRGITFDPLRNLFYVADTGNHAIRRIALDGAVTTFAGSGALGYAEGSGRAAQFNEPVGVAVDPAGVVYVADTRNSSIRKITLEGVVTTLAGIGKPGTTPVDGDALAASFNEPEGIVAYRGDVFVADTKNDAVRRISNGKVTTAFRDAALLKRLIGIAVDEAGDILFADTENDIIRKISLRGGGISTVAGTGQNGWKDGTPLSAQFKDPAGLTFAGGLFVADTQNDAVRLICPEVRLTGLYLPGGALMAGADVRLFGTGFVTGQTNVTFNGTPANAVTSISGTTLSARLAQAITGGSVEVRVTSCGGTGGPTSFVVDLTPPVIEVLVGGSPLVDGMHFNRDVLPEIRVTDANDPQPRIVATLNGLTYTLGSPITVEGIHTFLVKAEDAAGNKASDVTLRFTIDKTAPRITFIAPAAGAVVTTPRVVVSGNSDDAQSIVVNGVAATIDTATKIFTSSEIALVEGQNAINVVAVDRATNSSTASLQISLDTRPPELTITAPTQDVCVAGTTVELRGTVADPHLDKVTVTADGATGAAILDATRTSWSLVRSLTGEGKKSFTIEAIDTVGLRTTQRTSLTVDRTSPSIDLSEGGSPFSGGAFRRSLTLFVRATDNDPNVAVTVRVNGAGYTSGTTLAADGIYKLEVTATDCAANRSEKSVEFSIDRVAPAIRNLTPASGTRVGAPPPVVSGVTDSDVTKVDVIGTSISSVPATDGSFALAIPFTEGVNRFTLQATDRAGNVGEFAYSLAIKTSIPIVEIVENGAPLVNGAVFNRPVAPEIRTSEEGTPISATLNGAPFTSGAAISAEGAFTLIASASDGLGHTGSAQVSFTIDRTPPAIRITSPAMSGGQAASPVSTTAARIDVRGTCGDATSVAVNGTAAVIAADATFLVNIALEPGENFIVAVGRDRAGNTARDEIIVSRNSGPGVVVTHPPDGFLTNRATTDVIGRVLSPLSIAALTVDGLAVPFDASGAFHIAGRPLVSGDNVISVVTRGTNGETTSLPIRVIADFTPPFVRLLESGQPLEEGARFPAQAVVSATNSAGAVELIIDGARVASPITVTASGGHTAIAVGRDSAGNESRVERTFFIGTASTSACRLEGFDPPDGAVVTSSTFTLVGKSGGAAGVKVNGVPAIVSTGSFSASVQLPMEGPNSLSIVCTDASGATAGIPASLTFIRATNEPSITIVSPAEGAFYGTETIAVNGTIGAGVVAVEVNGAAATITGTAFTVPVRLASGVNVITARARNAAGRTATASRRVTYIKDAPALSISSPTAGVVTGSSSIEISGTWSNLDPTTVNGQISSGGQAPSPVLSVYSDTTGAFVFPNVSLVTGAQTFSITGRDKLLRTTTASIIITATAGVPSIAIITPVDNACVAADTLTVSGTYRGAPGSRIEVNGVAATREATTFSVAIPVSPITPIVARLTEPNGAEAIDIARVNRLVGPPVIREIFPPANAVGVDAGALILVSFSAPMSRASLSSAFRLETANGTPISGVLHLDEEILSFAPAATLAAGERLTIRISTAAKDLAGNALAAESATSFFVATSAPPAAPLIDPVTSPVCASTLPIKGTAPSNARLRIDAGGLTFQTTATVAGAYSFNLPLSGQSGFQVVRVRVTGSDGSLSPAAELQFNVDCAGPQVISATFDRTANRLTIMLSRAANPTITLILSDGRSVGSTISGGQAPSTVVIVTPNEDLTKKTFTLSVGGEVAPPFTQLFSSDEVPSAGDGRGFISGEVYDAGTGRPLGGATVTINGASVTTDSRGRYLLPLGEGAHTIRVSLTGYTTSYRQVVVSAGSGVIPIDVRLTRKGIQ